MFSGYADRKSHANFRGKPYQFSVLIHHYQNGASTLHAVIMVMWNLGTGREQKLKTIPVHLFHTQ